MTALRYVLLGGFTLFLFFLPGAARSQDSGAVISQKVIDVCKTGYHEYQVAVAYTHAQLTPPVPPEINPPCSQCGMSENERSESEADVNKWIDRELQGKTKAIKFLMGLARMDELFGNEYGDLSPEAQRCWQTLDPHDAQNKAAQIVANVYSNQAIPMAEKYDRNPKMAYAGISFLLAVARDYAIIGNATGGAQDAALEYARTWTSSVVDTADTRIFSGHEYNLCPIYVQLLRQLALLGGQMKDVSEIEATVTKLDKAMRFNVTMDLVAKGEGTDGGQMDVAWKGDADLYLDMDFGKGCYIPKIVTNSVAFENERFSITGKGAQVDLVSPHRFIVPVTSVTLNLCDAHPMLHIGLGAYPRERVTANGRPVPKPLYVFGGMMMAAVVGPKALSGNYTKAEATSVKSQMSVYKEQIDAHKHDPQWLMSSQGQAVIQKMQAVASGATGVGDAGTSKGGVPTAETSIAHDVGVNWANGTTIPVADVLALRHTHGGTLDDELHVTVEQVTQ